MSDQKRIYKILRYTYISSIYFPKYTNRLDNNKLEIFENLPKDKFCTFPIYEMKQDWVRNGP